jgi:hypothetical protein
MITSQRCAGGKPDALPGSSSRCRARSGGAASPARTRRRRPRSDHARPPRRGPVDPRAEAFGSGTCDLCRVGEALGSGQLEVPRRLPRVRTACNRDRICVMVISDKNREGGRARDLVGRARKLIRPPALFFRSVEIDRSPTTDRKGGAVALIRARTRKSFSRVRFPANRTLSRRRRMTESDPEQTLPLGGL